MLHQVMLQLGQNSILNQTTGRFVAHNACNYGYRARCCHLTAVSQRYYHAYAHNDSQLVLFNQPCRNKAMAGATIKQSYNIQLLDLLAPSATGYLVLV